MTYTDEQKAEIQAAFEGVEGEYEELFFKFLQLQLQSSDAHEFKIHGFLRRLGTLKHCLRNVYSICPVDRTDKPSKEELDNLAINIQAFVVGVFGCFDNLAWIWVKEKQPKNRKGEQFSGQSIGLVSAKAHEDLRKTFSQEFQEYLNSLEKWFAQLTDYRHALAHRIPLYVPPFLISPAEVETYNQIEREKEVAIQKKEFDKYEELDAAQEALGKFDPIAVHSVGGGSNPMSFHPQMIADFRTVLAVAERFLTEMKGGTGMTTDRANDLLERLERLDDATSQYLAFHFLVKDLHDRLPLPIDEQQKQHLDVITNVRAAIVRAYIAQGIAILDYTGPDKASVGQILHLLKDQAFREFLFETLRKGGDATPDEAAYAELATLYQTVTSSDAFGRAKYLRNKEIGHILMLPEKKVPYELLFGLSENIRQMLTLLHGAIGRRRPYFEGQLDELQSQAALFWNAYLAGMRGAPDVSG